MACTKRSFGGLAAGSKLNGVVFPVIPLLILVSDMVLRHVFRFRTWLIFIAPVVALMAPWYLRNYFWTGNLVYPFFSEWFGRQDALATVTLNLASTYGYGQDLAALFLVPFNLTFRGAAFDNGQLIGPIYLALSPLALFIAPDKRLVWLTWIFLGFYLLVWFYTAQLARYLVPILPRLAILASSAAMALLKMSFVLRLAAASVLVVSIAFGLGVTLLYDAQFFPVVFGGEPRDSFLAHKTWYYEEILWMNKNLPPNARVLMTDGMPDYLDRAHETGPLQIVLARHDVDYVFCIEDCPTKLRAAQSVYQSRAARVSSRTLQQHRDPVQTYVLQLKSTQGTNQTKP